VTKQVKLKNSVGYRIFMSRSIIEHPAFQMSERTRITMRLEAQAPMGKRVKGFDKPINNT
jgi:hypothetical protein